MSVAVDHLVVAAATLEQGAAWCEARFGVAPAPGGRHPAMGTHNRLLKLAGAAFPDCFLEIIAVDPEAPPPGRPRWFGLDDPALQARIAEAPRLIHVVARSTMLDMHRWGLIQLGLQPGDPLPMRREAAGGALAWQILVRPDGALLCGGALPTLIQWQGRHPAAALPDSGVTLDTLALAGVPDRVRTLLRLRGVEVRAGAGPAIRAGFASPNGAITLEST